ncbi:GPW/gp25 family protein [Streptomyces sp. JL3001]|uniref:GPW/gp25 family protein n=1 Tax=Streptomyces sp. JL3001 TaxID=3400923 RepID=UPI003B285537
MPEDSAAIRGVAFPFRVDPRTGGIGVSAGADKLRENVVRLLLTRIGERPMLREYGGGVTQLFQESVDEGMVAIARHQITRALLRFEPRVLPQEVGVVETEPGVLRLRVLYVDSTRPGLQSVVVPIG